MATQKKIEILEKLTEKLTKTNSLIVTDYHGLTHQQMEKLRKTVKSLNGEFIVTKNTLLKLAIEKTNLPQKKNLLDSFTGPIAILLTYADEIPPLQAVTNFIKQFQLPTLKVGTIFGKLLKGEELLVVAKLPRKEALLAQLAGQLNSPLYRLHHALAWNLQKLVLTLKAVEKTKMKSSQS